jgi:LPS export ABC transporter protein LptC
MRQRILKYFFDMAACFSCLFLFSCENDVNEVDSQFRKKIAVEEAFNVDAYLSGEGKMKAHLTAPYMLRYQADSPYIEFPRTLHVDFYDDSLSVESTLDALYAKNREFEKKVFLRDSVVVINKLRGDTLRTSELWWDQNKETFYTDKPVRIFQKTKIIFGIGMTSKQDFTEWNIFNMTGIAMVPPSGIPN